MALLRGFIPYEIRIPVFILVIAALVTGVDLAMNAWLHSFYQVLGIFIPLLDGLQDGGDGFGSEVDALGEVLGGEGVGELAGEDAEAAGAAALDAGPAVEAGEEDLAHRDLALLLGEAALDEVDGADLLVAGVGEADDEGADGEGAELAGEGGLLAPTGEDGAEGEVGLEAREDGLDLGPAADGGGDGGVELRTY